MQCFLFGHKLKPITKIVFYLFVANNGDEEPVAVQMIHAQECVVCGHRRYEPLKNHVPSGIISYADDWVKGKPIPEDQGYAFAYMVDQKATIQVSGVGDFYTNLNKQTTPEQPKTPCRSGLKLVVNHGD